MPDIKYKYRINELMHQLSVNEYRKAIRLIPIQLGISERTFTNYRKIRQNDKRDIPHEKVDLLEKLFGLATGQLQNFTWIARPIAETNEQVKNLPRKINL
ncbi:hypothetical protein KHS38_05105 [Mucilaginibacter sp. Bleaf8]|uniref:hypothetical protein n=1 Tax=Mucilaginibacter sp. Bleaf8 TaxID=2834430 RepID=UPI001BCDB739|nr:hypothetical protein [Mucilaginibacter sp. Bleaf8]MBS7563774.1 hypothetical protein [Mucilaginibacter sp. Bleaf8]